MEDFGIKIFSLLFICTDEFGSTNAVAESSAFKKNISYQPFGFQLDSLLGYIGFVGQLQEPSVRSYMLGNGYRVYIPTLYRLCSPDSYSPFGQGGINAYSYCQGDPINLVDPSGHSFFRRVLRPVLRPIRRLFRRSRVNGPRLKPEPFLLDPIHARSPITVPRPNALENVGHVSEKSAAWTTRNILPPQGSTASDIWSNTTRPFINRRSVSGSNLSTLSDLPPDYEPPPSYNSVINHVSGESIYKKNPKLHNRFRRK